MVKPGYFNVLYVYHLQNHKCKTFNIHKTNNIYLTYKVTSSPLSLKRNPSSVSACSGSSGQGPASPLRRAVSSVSERSAASGVSSLGSVEAGQRRMVAASPCTCGQQQPPQPLQGHENYDIPRNLGRQVRTLRAASHIVCVSVLFYCLQNSKNYFKSILSIWRFNVT